MKLLILASAVVISMTVVSVSARAAEGDAAVRLHALFDDHWQWRMREFPEEAMSRGDYRFADRITDVALDAIERRHADRQRFLKRLRAIDHAALGEEDRLSYDLFDLMLSREVDGHRFRAFLMPIGSRFGPHQSIPQMHERARFQTVEDYENYLKRLALVPESVRDTIANMRLGLADGRTPPRITLRDVPAQVEALVDGGLERLGEPFAEMPQAFDSSVRQRLRDGFQDDALPAVRGAMHELHLFLRDEYVPACRDTIAAADYPDGEAYYRHQLKVMTTLDLTPREVHEVGLREVARIRGEMMDVIRRSDFVEREPTASSMSDDELFAAFLEYLRTDEQFYYDDPQALIDGYKAICKTVDGHMPRFFATLPRQPYGVREIPAFMAPSQTTAYYSSGDVRNGQPGYFYANTYALHQRPKYEMIALAMHEAVPGHHHQIALDREQEGLPPFRQEMWITAYGEGWALYAERLGLEMGLYDDPYDDFGRLLYEMWRACRLVVDPGIHALGWSRQEAINFMLTNTALSELNIINEVDRYIAWPGQACAYKLGELKIRELRERAEGALGEHFDLRRFHDAVLLAGPLPLPVLEERINARIEAERPARR